MAFVVADRVWDKSTTTGTGALTLTGAAPDGHRSIASVCAVADTLPYAIESNPDDALSEWEVGIGTYSGANTLTRTLVLSSSNAGAAVNFSAGTKNVILTVPARNAYIERPLAVADGGTGQTTEAEAVGELIQALSADATPDFDADYLATYDASADTGKKVLLTTVVRKRLAANATINVPGDFASAQAVYNYAVGSLDFGGKDVTIQMADGAYDDTDGVIDTTVGPWTGGGNVIWQGNLSDRTAVTITGNTGISLLNQATNLPGLFYVKNMRPTTFYQLITASGIGRVNVVALDTGDCDDAYFGGNGPGATISISGDYTVFGDCYAHMYNYYTGSLIRYFPGTVTASGTRAAAIFANALNGSMIESSGVTFSGTFTGKRYEATQNAIIQTGGGGANYFPGDAAGSVADGGIYV